MPYTRKPRKATRGRKPRTQKRPPLKKPSKTFVKQVQRIINKNAEDKQAYASLVNYNYNSGINSSADLNFILPNIATGVADNERIGDQIMCKNFTVKGHIISNLTYNSYSQCRIGLRLMVVQPKTSSSSSLISNDASNWLSYLLKKGGTTTGFSGLVSDLYAPINTDAITKYYDRVMYINSPYQVGTVSGALDVATYNSTKFFSITMPRCKKKLLKYDESVGSDLTPTHYNPVLILGYCHLDSAAPDTVSAQLNLSWVSTMSYQDS